MRHTGQSIASWLGRHWFGGLVVLLALYAGLPFLAPLFMQLGWSSLAKLIYLAYSFQCHQLPQRSFFLFGDQAMYPLSDIQAYWGGSSNPIVMRRFIGLPGIGWKVAWSDRMVAMYTSLLAFTVLWRVVRQRIKPLPWWGLALFLLPMALDGTSHLLSDLAGVGQGFRDSNTWLAALTGYRFSATFYNGDALGSFNSWMRLVSGLLFGLGLAWSGLPALESMFGSLERDD